MNAPALLRPAVFDLEWATRVAALVHAGRLEFAQDMARMEYRDAVREQERRIAERDAAANAMRGTVGEAFSRARALHRAADDALYQQQQATSRALDAYRDAIRATGGDPFEGMPAWADIDIRAQLGGVIRD